MNNNYDEQLKFPTFEGKLSAECQDGQHGCN